MIKAPEKQQSKWRFGRKTVLLFSSLAALGAGGFGLRAEFNTLRDKADDFSARYEIPNKHRNAIHHAYSSMVMADRFSAPVSEFLGFGVEAVEAWDGRNRDRYKDFWNNAIGRQVATFSKETGLSKEALLLDAYKSGQIIRHHNTDPRVKDGFFEYPRPKYRGPSRDYQAAAAIVADVDRITYGPGIEPPVRENK